MRSISINGNKAPGPGIASTAGIRAAFHVPAPPVEDSNYILLETKGPLDGPEKQALQEKGVVILEYVGDEVYLCGFKPTNLKEVIDGLDFVVDAEVYNPAYVVESGLKPNEETQGADDGDAVAVEIALHDDVDEEACSRICEDIAAKAGLASSDVEVTDGKAHIKVSKSKLQDLAEIDEVKTINKAHERRLFNNIAGGIMEVHKPIGLNNAIYKGKGQIVCVADTGFDTGNKDACHQAFQDRVLATHGLGRPGKADDLDGHGTHVAGSVLGNGNHSEQGAIEAPASEAKLIFQSLFDKFRKPNSNPRSWQAGLGGIPATWPKLFDPPFQQGARIHTNSWGGGPSPYQDADTGKLDLYLRNKKKLVVLFAAGNSGTDVDSNQGHVDPYSLGAEASAKNTITVGASENLRKDVTYPEIASGQPLTYGRWYDDYPYAPISTDNVADNPEGLAAFSSRGPTQPDGRIKPDVVAPGTTILSTKSSAVYPGHDGEFWGHSTDPKWYYEGGTSMATPLTAGCCAVIRGALVENGHPDPSAALVKAVLINGAVPIKGQYNQVGPNGEFTNITATQEQQARQDPDGPNPHSGFGRVNLNNSLQNVVPGIPNVLAGLGDKDGADALGRDGRQPKEASFDIVVPWMDVAQTLKVTLVYDDMPGERLQNDLNLVVKEVGGTGREKHGNMGDAPGFDRVNNVEQVVWKDAKGTFRVTISAYRTTHDPQPYAFAWRVFPAA